MSIDTAARSVTDRTRKLSHDHVIVAAGAAHAYIGHDEWAPFAPGLKVIGDVRVLRDRLLAFERADTLCGA